MKKGLSFTISSDFISASGRFEKDNPIVIQMWVESFDDIKFWSNVRDNTLALCNNPRLRINITAPSLGDVSHGKDSLIKAINENFIQLGVNQLVAFDSDFDYLLDYPKLNYKSIIDSGFSLETFCYSCENFFCDPQGLLTICEKTASASFQGDFCFNNFISKWSHLLHEVFLNLMCLYKVNLKVEADKFHDALKISSANLTKSKDIKYYKENFFSDLEVSLDKIKKDMNDFIISIPNIDIIKSDFEVKGLTVENSYLFYKGHNLFDDIIIPIAKNIKTYITKNVCNAIKSSQIADDKTQLMRQLTNNQAEDIHIEKVISCRQTYPSNPFYPRIVEKLSLLLSTHHGSVVETPSA